MLKVALTAGHYLYTPGKRCLKSIDKNETREWVLNSRIANKVEENLKAYTGYKLLRTDDKSGKTDISVEARAKAANDFGADIYISVHHNAGIKGGSGGGIVAYTYLKVNETTEKLQKLLYNKLIEKTGLKGNRANPMPKADFAECRLTKMPAVLLECGFMDSINDTPLILTEDFANSAALAITEAVAEWGKLKKKPIPETPPEAEKLPEQTNPEKMYYVQAGAFKSKSNAEKLVKQLKDAGFSAIIKS